MQRESFGSRLGFLLVSAGCAIGIGNVWRFPYITGKNGGGYFVLFYLVCLLLLGVPVMTMELAVGRGGRKSAVLAYKNLEKPGSKWHLHGWFCLAGCYLLMMYYTTVTGWMVNYFGKFLTGGFHAGMTGDEISGMFGTMLGSPGSMAIFTELVVVTGLIVCSFGLQKGLERVTKVMMICLLALIVVLAVHSLTLSGAAEGMKFYLLPSVDTIREHGLGSLITDAMNQAFFTLSLGIGAMEIFGSYMSDEQTLPGEAVRICCLDTFVALMSGMIIFPACFSFGLEPGQGPSLIFMTLPRVFVSMTGGRLWGALFFLFLTFASFTTVLAVFENIMASCMDNFGWSRKKATIVCGIFILLASMPCVLGYNLWYFEASLPSGATGQILDIEDFLVSNLLLPIGSLIYLLFCVSKWGWGFDKYLAEANKGTGLGMSIVKELLNKLGGSIQVSSTLGQGTTFAFRLPFAVDTQDEETQALISTDKSCKLAGVQVLLVEDNEINMEIAEFYLTERGAAVAKAWNGREAVEKVKAEPRRFDVVLMDVMMPVLDGLAATREIRALPYPAAGVPILAMTAQDTREAAQECKDAGMNDYLAKPVDPNRMAEKILHWTRQQAETSSPAQPAAT